MQSLIGFYKKAYTIIGIVVFVIGFAISFFLDYLITDKPNIPESIPVLFWLFLINNTVSYFLVYKQAVLVVDQKQYVVSLVRQFVHIGQVAIQCLILFVTKNYYLYLICQIVGTVVTNLSLSIYVNRKYSWMSKTGGETLSKEDKDAIFKDVKALSISKIAGVVSNGTDSIIITKLFGLAPVGLVSNYSMVINTINGFLWSALSSVTGSIGRFNVDSALERKRSVFNEVYLITFWLYTLVCVCFMVLLDPLITVWLGAQYLIDKTVTAALVFNIFVCGINFPFYTFRITHGIFEPMKYNYVVSAATNVVLSIFLGAHFGLAGVFLATGFARIICVEWKEGRIVFREILQQSFLKYFAQYGFSLVFLFATYCVTQFIVNFIPIVGWYGLILKAIISVAIINVLFCIAFMRTKAFEGLWKKAKSLLVRHV